MIARPTNFQPRAFTLIETILAVAIVAGTLLVVISLLASQSDAVQDMRRTERQSQQRDKTVDLLRHLNPTLPEAGHE